MKGVRERERERERERGISVFSPPPLLSFAIEQEDHTSNKATLKMFIRDTAPSMSAFYKLLGKYPLFV